MTLPQKLPLELMQTQWGQKLNPLVANPIMQGLAIYNISTSAGAETVIPTTLNRMQLGWFLIDNTGNSSVWRTKPFNDKNLTVTTDNATTIAIWVF